MQTDRDANLSRQAGKEPVARACHERSRAAAFEHVADASSGEQARVLGAGKVAIRIDGGFTVYRVALLGKGALYQQGGFDE